MNKISSKFLKIILFLIFTLIWSIFVYLIKGEWLYFIPLVVSDILFFETISWQFWKKKKKKEKKSKKGELRNWIEAILFAVVAATILRTFLIEAYTIPTSSMEKSMLIGDFLFVSKTSYALLISTQLKLRRPYLIVLLVSGIGNMSITVKDTSVNKKNVKKVIVFYDDTSFDELVN